MNSLDAPRIIFTGRFISDVSTINNEPRNFDPATAQPEEDWNPRGGATFDFCDCRVTGGLMSAGSVGADPVLGLALSGASDRPSAKMVDLDPDWQRASEIWGLSVRLIDPETGDLGLEGTFEIAAFRDLFERQRDLGAPNGQSAGGRYVSVLRNVAWGPLAARSPLLQQLRAETEDDRLTIILNVFGYYYNDVGRHATGALVGWIGPHHKGDAATFIIARRLQPLAREVPNQRPAMLIGAADAAVDAGRGLATVDLGHALLIADPDGKMVDLSKLQPSLAEMKALAFGVLPDESVASGDRLPPGTATIFGEVDWLRPGWYAETGGVASFKIDAAAAQFAVARPLALLARLADGSHRVLNRETRDGIYVRADNFVHRLDPGDAAEVILHARRYGEPAANLVVHFASVGEPAGALTFRATATTDADGVASLRLAATDPGNPRRFIDGQVYAVAYAPRLDGEGAPDYAATGLNPMLDVIVAHIRTGIAVPDRPEWHRDVEPIMAQYAKLYPIMSRHLFDFGDYDAVVQHRQKLLFAFQRSIEDPNYMPVTRDLSRNKRAMIIKWLQNETHDPREPLVKGTPLVVAAAPAAAPPPLSPLAARIGAADVEDVKTAMAQLAAVSPTPVLRDT
jgi:hypothetical protein